MASFLRVIATVTAVVTLILTLTYRPAAHPSIDIVASNWQFTPATITLQAGEPVDLHTTSKEGVHGLQSDELGIPLTLIEPGKYTDIEITPKRPARTCFTARSCAVPDIPT